MRRAASDRNCLFLLLAVGIGWSPLAASAETPSQRTLGTGHTQPVVALVFSPDGKSLASASFDKTIILWDTRTGRVRLTLKGHTRVPCALAFSADGKTLVSCSRDNHRVQVLRWSTDDGFKNDERILSVYNVLSSELPAFSRDGRKLTTITHIVGRPNVRVWDVATGTILKEYETRSSTKMASRPPSLSFSPDGKLIATVEAKKSVRIVSTVDDRDEVFPQRLNTCRSAIFSPDGKTITAVVSTGDGRRLDGTSVLILDVAKKKTIRSFPVGVGRTEVALSPDGTLLASIGQGIDVWNTSTGKFKTRLIARRQNTFGHQRLAFSPDGRYLAAPNGSRVEIWDTSKFK